MQAVRPKRQAGESSPAASLEIEMKALKLHAFATAAALVAFAIASPPAMAAGPAAASAHDHATDAPAALALNQGRKWATDQPLRTGMNSIRSLVEQKLDAAHAGKLTPAQSAALAAQIEAEVGGIVANCKLEPRADAMLHLVIGEIGAGTEALAGKAAGKRPEQGLVQVATAVNHYAKYFDHPKFKPLHVGH